MKAFRGSPVRNICLAFLLAAALCGCASKTDHNLPAVEAASAEAPKASHDLSDADFEDYGDEHVDTISDPLEGWNRFWFGFNDILLLKVIKPVYTGYTYVVPSPIRTGIGNAFHNIQMPIRLVNCILQGRFGEAWIELGRFIVNSTAGFGGVFDVAKQSKPRIPVDSRDADFGQTLGVWGVGEGIYLVWPVVGPSTVRDTAGMAGDWAASPLFWLGEPVGPVEQGPAIGASLGFRFNNMGTVIDTYETLTKSAIEPYTAARDAYVKYRRSGIMPNRFQ